ncbi:MAG: hypothetical protein ACQESE_03315 [Nanobdellota archaeon]
MKQRIKPHIILAILVIVIIFLVIIISGSGDINQDNETSPITGEVIKSDDEGVSSSTSSTPINRDRNTVK